MLESYLHGTVALDDEFFASVIFENKIKEVTTLMPEEVESIVIRDQHIIRNNHQAPGKEV